MAFQLETLPKTGVESIDAVLAYIGATYVVLSALQIVVPKDSTLSRLLATFTADLHGVLSALGRAKETPVPDAPKKPGHRETKARKKPT